MKRLIIMLFAYLMIAAQNNHIVKAPDFREVTSHEVRAFLMADDTNLHPYIDGVYNCRNFSNDLYARATKAGFEVHIVKIDYGGLTPRHVIVAFETTDRGLFYVEPQTDTTYPNPVVGNYLCDASTTGEICLYPIHEVISQ